LDVGGDELNLVTGKRGVTKLGFATEAELERLFLALA
jgi:hypothetical protein